MSLAMLFTGLLLALLRQNLSAVRLEQTSSRQPTPTSGLLRLAGLEDLDSCLIILIPFSSSNERC